MLTSQYKKYMNNRQLILLENLVDIIHDVVAEGNLSYNGILSIDLIVKSYTALYGYQEEEGWELLNRESKIANWLSANAGPAGETHQEKFKRWYMGTVEGNATAKSFGVARERAYKECMYVWMKNKYIMNPTYTSEGVDVEILTEWQYANTTDRVVDVAPYGGGSIRNGVKLWEYILGRGNSFLEHDQSDATFNYNWVEESIKIPPITLVQEHRC